MASLADIRNRIGSVKNTRQITRAMKLVAGAKLARATNAALAAKPYQEALTRVLGRVVQSAGDVDHPLLKVPDNDTDVLVVLMTSDRGLCGASIHAFVETLSRRLTLCRNGQECSCCAMARRDVLTLLLVDTM